jgi:hypothetical protein
VLEVAVDRHMAGTLGQSSALFGRANLFPKAVFLWRERSGNTLARCALLLRPNALWWRSLSFNCARNLAESVSPNLLLCVGGLVSCETPYV